MNDTRIAQQQLQVLLEPDRASLGIHLARAVMKTGNWVETDRLLARALLIDGNSIVARQVMTSVRFWLDRLPEAEITAREWIALGDVEAMAQFMLGRILRKRGRLDEATRMLQQAVLVDPSLYRQYQIVEMSATTAMIRRELAEMT